jgi:hypothetical protein
MLVLKIIQKNVLATGKVDRYLLTAAPGTSDAAACGLSFN